MYFAKALIEQLEETRGHYLALTFLSLGHTAHLLEDMGVPPHTRNDFLFAHYRPPASAGNPFESWVEDQVKANGGQCPWSGSGPVVFDRLAEYFDADVYVGDYLGDGETPPEGIWGLAECSNYQFLSLSTVFGCTGIKYQFPHPAKEHTVIQTETNKTYFDGYGVQHLARESYTHHMVSSVGFAYDLVDSTNTTDDAGVFEDYAGITIPRTIDYATGLINYFFRGRLNVKRGSADPNITTELVITNTSNNSGIPQALKGGTFEIYRDDVNEIRTQVPPGDITFIPAWTETRVLPNDGGTTELIARFAPLAEEARNYVVVYKGQISELPDDPDPDDANAIAAGILRGGYEIFAWTDYPDIGDEFRQVSDAPEGADFIDIATGMRHCLALRTDGSIEAWGRDNYGQVSGKPTGNDVAAIAAGRNHSLALKSDGSIVVWGDNSSNQITDKPSGNGFVAITAGDYHNLALKSDGSIIAWGRNSSNQCNVPDPDPGTVYTAIAAGSAHSLALQSDGMIKAWGSNAAGQTTIYPDVETDNKAIAACSNYNLLLRTDGVLKSWGGGDWKDPETRTIPRYHDRPADANDFVAIAAGADHILALTSDGRILAWEWPTGPFAFDSFSTTVPEGIVFTEAVSAGNKFSLGLKAP
jgi:hypothetical protein